MFENGSMPEHPDDDPRTPSDGDVEDALTWLGLTNRPTADELALIAELAEVDRAYREAGLLEDWDWGIEVAEAAWVEAVVTDDELVAGLARGVHEADLLLLASIDEEPLGEPRPGRVPAGVGPGRCACCVDAARSCRRDGG